MQIKDTQHKILPNSRKFSVILKKLNINDTVITIDNKTCLIAHRKDNI